MNSEAIKNLSTFLAQNLKDKEIKQSLLLEVLAKYEGYNDWNTLVGIENKNKVLSEEGWSRVVNIHIDNGGYSFSYNKVKKILKIETGFYGYSSNTHFFSFSKKDLKLFKQEGNRWSKFINDEDNEKYFDKKFFPDSESNFYFNHFQIVFKNQHSIISLDAALVYEYLIDNIDIFE